LVLAAFDLWDQQGHVSLGEVIDRLTIDHLDQLFALVLAVKTQGDKPLDEWLARYSE
jgi:hypothetical protein